MLNKGFIFYVYFQQDATAANILDTFSNTIYFSSTKIIYREAAYFLHACI